MNESVDPVGFPAASGPSYVFIEPLYVPGRSTNVIEHVVPVAVSAHPFDVSVKPISRVKPGEHFVHPVAGAIAIVADWVEGETNRERRPNRIFLGIRIVSVP